VDGLTRVLAAETGPLGIRYLVVEPGGFATDWAGASMQVLEIPEEYQQTVGEMRRYRSSARAAGDPKRAGEILVRMVRRHELPTISSWAPERCRWRRVTRKASSPSLMPGRRSAGPLTSVSSTRSTSRPMRRPCPPGRAAIDSPLTCRC
jgi:hypothetical protein